MMTDGVTGEPRPLYVPERPSHCQYVPPIAEPVQPTRFVVQQAHELPSFSLDGGQSLAQYLYQFEEHCSHVYTGNLDQSLPLLKSKLAGPILDVFVACGDITSSYQNVKRRMLDWVQRQEPFGNRSARDRFRRCKRNQGESLALYALRLASVFNDAYPDQDVQTSQELRQHLLDNLPQRAADYLRRQLHYTREIHGITLTWRNLSSLLERERLDDDVMSDADPSMFYAAEQENRSRPSRTSQRRTTAASVRPARRDSSRTWHRRASSTQEQQHDQQPRQRGHSSSGSSTTSERRPPLRCHFCGRPGHIERECRRKQGLCFACGRPGHYMRDCNMPRSRQRSQSTPRYPASESLRESSRSQRVTSPDATGGTRRVSDRRDRQDRRQRRDVTGRNQEPSGSPSSSRSRDGRSSPAGN